MPCGAHPAWCRFWAVYAVVTIVVGAVGDTVAYVHGGYPATLTGHIRRWTGMEPTTRYQRLGQAGVMGFLTWAAVHLGFGVLGPNRGRR